MVTVLLFTAPSVEAFGGIIADNVVYDVSGSPYMITQDITIEKGGVLTIEPGVTVTFDPGVGVTVKGILRAEVSRKKRRERNRLPHRESFKPSSRRRDLNCPL